MDSVYSQQVESHQETKNRQHERDWQTTMMPGRDRNPSTWRTGLIASSNKWPITGLPFFLESRPTKCLLFINMNCF